MGTGYFRGRPAGYAKGKFLWAEYSDYAGYILSFALLAYFIIGWGGSFFDPYIQNNDTRSFIFPFWGMHENLFKNDFVASLTESYSPLLFKWIYFAGTFVLSPLYLTKVVHIIAVSWAMYHLYSIGHRRAGGMGGLLALYLALHNHFILEKAAGGLPRAFGLPVILMTLDGMDRGNRLVAGIGVTLGFGLYPSSGLVLLLCYVLWIASAYIKERKSSELRKDLTLLVSVMVICLSFQAAMSMRIREFGRTYSAEEAKSMPEFQRNGRVHEIPIVKLHSRLARDFVLIAKSSGDSPIKALEKINKRSFVVPQLKGVPLLLIIGIAVGIVIVRKDRSALLAVYLMISGISLFFVATIAAFKLYTPNRMVTFPFAAAVMFILIAAFAGAGSTQKSRGVTSLTAAVVISCFLGVSFATPLGMKVNVTDQAELLEVIRSLPKEALLAGHPGRMNDIPLWGKRSVLISWETSQPWQDKAWEVLKRRTYDSFKACYATDARPIVALMEKYGVDYFLVHEDDLSVKYKDSCHYYEPFEGWLQDLCVMESTDIYWNSVPEEGVVGRASGFTIYDLHYLKRITGAASILTRGGEHLCRIPERCTTTARHPGPTREPGAG